MRRWPMHFEISSRITGRELGFWKGDTADEAIMRMLVEAGYESIQDVRNDFDFDRLRENLCATEFDRVVIEIVSDDRLDKGQFVEERSNAEKIVTDGVSRILWDEDPDDFDGGEGLFGEQLPCGCCGECDRTCQKEEVFVC